MSLIMFVVHHNDETQHKSLEDGRKAIDMENAVAKKEGNWTADEEEKKDQEQWRNDG